MVSVEDEREARKLLEPFQRPRPLSEITPDLAGDPKNPRKVPLVQRVGVWVVGLFLVIGGVPFLYESLEERSIPLAIVSIGWVVGLPWVFSKILMTKSK